MVKIIENYWSYRSQTSSGSSPLYNLSSDSKLLDKKKQTKSNPSSTCIKSCPLFGHTCVHYNRRITRLGCQCLLLLPWLTVSAGWQQSWVRPAVDSVPGAAPIRPDPASVAGCFLYWAPILHPHPLPSCTSTQLHSRGKHHNVYSKN